MKESFPLGFSCKQRSWFGSIGSVFRPREFETCRVWGARKNRPFNSVYLTGNPIQRRWELGHFRKEKANPQIFKYCCGKRDKLENMSVEPDPSEKQRRDLDQDRVAFLKTDLDMCFTLAALAETRFDIGDRELAEAAIQDAEKGYETLKRFLSDPKHTSHMSAEQHGELSAGLQRLRERLDGLRGRS